MAKPLTLNDLPEDLAHFARAEMTAGRFATVEDVLRAGKDALERRQRNEQKMAALRTAIAEGDASPDFDGNPFASVRAKLGLPIGKGTTA